MASEQTDRTEPGKATEQVEELELDDKQPAAQPLEWPRDDPQRHDPEHDTEPSLGTGRTGGSGRVEGPEEEALHPETDEE